MTNQSELFGGIVLLFMWFISGWAALAQLSGGRVRKIESKDRKLADKAEDWIEHREEYIIVFRFISFFAIALLGTLTFSIVEKIEGYQWSPTEVSILSGVITFLVVAVAEIISRALIFRFDIQLLRVTIPVIRMLRYSVFYPIVLLVETIHRRLEEKHSDESGGGHNVSAEDEILSLVENDDEEEGETASLEEDEKRMIRGIFDLSDTQVREIMTPRVDVVGISVDASIDDAKKKFSQSGHSRIPVFKDSIDEIKGVIFAKDFLDENVLTGRGLESIAHKPIFVPETKEVGELLKELKNTRNHFAVIIDEYGGTAGIVTLEDILEEIVGEIHDEYDLDVDSSMDLALQPDGSMILNGRALISDVNEHIDGCIPEDVDADTVGGYVCAELGRIPESGEEAVLNNRIKVTILKADRRKILKLKISTVNNADQ